HGFALANLPDCVTHLLQVGLIRGIAEKSLQIAVLEDRFAILCQLITDLQNNILSALTAIEYAGPVGESTIIVTQLRYLPGGNLQHAHLANRLRHLLPVGAHVLHRRATHRTGDAAQALEPGTIMFHGESYKVVPAFSCARIKQHFVFLKPKFDPPQGNLQHQARPSFIGYDKIASATKHKKWQLAIRGEVEGFLNFRFGPWLHQIAGGSAHSQSSE